MAQTLYSDQIISTHYKYFLTSEVGVPEAYNEVVNALNSASENDTFKFIINSTGGNYFGSLLLISGIETTKATTTASLQGPADSAASIIALACDAVELFDYSEMLVHFASYGMGNRKALDQMIALTHMNKQLERSFRRAYNGFLSEEEILRCISGLEMELDSDEISARLIKRDLYNNQRTTK